MIVHVAMPARRRGQKLAFSFDEDDLTLAWEALRKAGLPAGAKVHTADVTVPAWFWQGTGFVPDADAPWTVRAIPTTLGPAVVVHPSGAIPDIEEAARALHAATPERKEPDWQRHRTAREGPDTEADFPLGAFVLAARHEEVTAQRMRLGPGKVASWTAIGAGAAPTEFLRLQEAVGAYHVVLADVGGAATVGLWAGDAPPATGQACVPVLRRLFRTQGAWRHGVKFTDLQAKSDPVR
jgi:hypothetical protein